MGLYEILIYKIAYVVFMELYWAPTKEKKNPNSKILHALWLHVYYILVD